MNYLLTFNENWADEHNVPAQAVMTADQLANWKTSIPEVNANLGNSGEGFENQFPLNPSDGDGEPCQVGQDFVDAGFVTVVEVDEPFAQTFEAASLASLSLCPIFTSFAPVNVNN